MDRMRIGMGILLAVLWVTTADADPKKAKALNVQGMKLYGKKQYYQALEAFKKAIALDPSYVWPHYNAASMASLLEDFPVVISELEWCVASKDPVAVKAMSTAKADKDLEKAIMHPRVRELVGLPALDKLTPEQILLERTGVWGADGSACGMPAYTFTFKKGGALAAALEGGCNEHHSVERYTGKWKIDAGKVVVMIPKAKTSFSGTFGACNGNDPKQGHCLNLTEGDDGNEYTFARGAADLQ